MTALRIGLLNTMPAVAAAPTQALWVSLLADAAGPRAISLRAFTPAQTDALFAAELDGLIVTGTVPIAAAMVDEPVWPALAAAVDWAALATVSTIWSCLAAHAAVWRLDGIPREPLPVKLSGVYRCAAVAGDPLISGLPHPFSVPHSRSNGLAEAALLHGGYTVLSRGPLAGVDAFTKPVGRSQFVFLQGHPEYSAATLLREYRRDVRAFLAGERPTHPAVPETYLDPPVARTLHELARSTIARPDPAMLTRIDTAITTLPGQPWRPYAVQLCAAWLSLIEMRRDVSANRLATAARVRC